MKRFFYGALMMLLSLGFVSCNKDDDDAEYFYCSSSVEVLDYSKNNTTPEVERFVAQWINRIDVAMTNCYLPRVTEAEAFRRYSIAVTNMETLVNTFDQEVKEKEQMLKDLDFSYVISVFYAKESEPLMMQKSFISQNALFISPHLFLFYVVFQCFFQM